jgi:hypothetical protein
MKVRILLTAVSLLLPAAALAGDTFRDVEYLAGKAGFEKKVKGLLTIDEKEVTFVDQKGKILFAIPVAEIDKAEAGSQREEGSFGRKMALGIFASKTQEYLHVESHNATGAEAVVFKVKKKTGVGMATKINFWADHARQPASNAVPPPPSPDLPPFD